MNIHLTETPINEMPSQARIPYLTKMPTWAGTPVRLR